MVPNEIETAPPDLCLYNLLKKPLYFIMVKNKIWLSNKYMYKLNGEIEKKVKNICIGSNYTS